jgi:hypothetical protein
MISTGKKRFILLRDIEPWDGEVFKIGEEGYVYSLDSTTSHPMGVFVFDSDEKQRKIKLRQIKVIIFSEYIEPILKLENGDFLI